jgi:hypothetical protein
LFASVVGTCSSAVNKTLDWFAGRKAVKRPLQFEPVVFEPYDGESRHRTKARRIENGSVDWEFEAEKEWLLQMARSKVGIAARALVLSGGSLAGSKLWRAPTIYH